MSSGYEAEQAGGDQRVVIVGLELVAGQLLADEPVVGQVVVEGADHVVAILVGVGAEAVLLEAFGFAVADDVEPVLGPAFAVAGRGEQAVDDFDVGVGRIDRRETRPARPALAGRPVRSKVTRRRSVNLSAGEFGSRFLASSFSAMKLSIGFRVHLPRRLSSGTAGPLERSEGPFTVLEFLRCNGRRWIGFRGSGRRRCCCGCHCGGRSCSVFRPGCERAGGNQANQDR